eukprot:SAG22_NODE_14310_length_378_cov_0.738351_1_plen_57_part_01
MAAAGSPLKMSALAKMATMQEHLTQDEDAAFSHEDAVFSVFEYDGRRLEKQFLPADA